MIVIQPHLTILSEEDQNFFIIKSGHPDKFIVVDEDPGGASTELCTQEEVITLAQQFDPNYTESQLPIPFWNTK